MSELIDKTVLIANMYSEAFESDTDMQRWDSGCWIRYKLFEKVVDSTPTVPYGPRWHRVEDELPEIGKIVLVYDDWDRLSICQLDKHYRWLRQGGGWFDVPYVRYWMPIEPPKED